MVNFFLVSPLTGLLLSILRVKTPWKLLVDCSLFRTFVFQESSNPIFASIVVPLRNAAQPAIAARLLQSWPLCSWQVDEDAEGIGHELYLDSHTDNVHRASLHF